MRRSIGTVFLIPAQLTDMIIKNSFFFHQERRPKRTFTILSIFSFIRTGKCVAVFWSSSWQICTSRTTKGENQIIMWERGVRRKRNASLCQATGICQSSIATVKERKMGFKRKPSNPSRAAIVRGSKRHTQKHTLINQEKIGGHTRGRLWLIKLFLGQNRRHGRLCVYYTYVYNI